MNRAKVSAILLIIFSVIGTLGFFVLIPKQTASVPKVAVELNPHFIANSLENNAVLVDQNLYYYNQSQLQLRDCIINDSVITIDYCSRFIIDENMIYNTTIKFVNSTEGVLEMNMLSRCTISLQSTQYFYSNGNKWINTTVTQDQNSTATWGEPAK